MRERHRTLDYRDRTHSELGPAAFAATTRNGVNVCPQAWYLQRCGAPRSRVATALLESGIQKHRHIGRKTDRLRTADMF
jgi:hypothetical protein